MMTLECKSDLSTGIAFIFIIALLLCPSTSRGQATATWSAGSSQLGIGLRVGMSRMGEYNSVSMIGAQLEYINQTGFEANNKGIWFGLIRYEVGIERWGATPDEIYALAATAKWYPPIHAPRLKPYLGLGGGGFNIYSNGDCPSGIMGEGHVALGLEYRGGWDSQENNESTWFLQARAGYISSRSDFYLIILNGLNFYNFPFF